MEQRNEVADFQLSDMILRALNLDEANRSKPKSEVAKAAGQSAQAAAAAKADKIFSKSFELLKEQHDNAKEDNMAKADELRSQSSNSRSAANALQEGGQVESTDRYYRFTD